ncbi:MAG: hypothetical protein IPJ84_05280 [Bdellovibrionales bacterium]|nr:hypothetical protein [Bdellovibrionales bacterium]
MKFLKIFKIPAINKFVLSRKSLVENLRVVLAERFSSEILKDNSIEGQAKTFRLWVLISGVTLLICAISNSSATTGASPTTPQSDSTDITAQIPEGMLVVPIQAANYSTLDPLLDRHAWADIYLPSLDGSRGVRIAESIPLIRAPQNRQHLAALIPEGEPSALLSVSDPVIVILRSSPKKRVGRGRPAAPEGRKNGPLRRETRSQLHLIEEMEITNEAE